MNESRARANIAWSMRHGAARMVDQHISLTRDQIADAVVLAASGNAAAGDRVVHSVSRLACRVSMGYYLKWASHLPPSASFCDVFSASLEGVNRAIGKFDPAKGYAFTTYSEHWMKTGAQRACYAAAGTVRIPERQLKAGVAADDPRVASAVLSLDAGGPCERDLHEAIADSSDELEDPSELVRCAMAVLESVDARLPRIVLLIAAHTSYSEIGRILGAPPEQVRKLHAQGQAAVERSEVGARYLSTL